MFVNKISYKNFEELIYKISLNKRMLRNWQVVDLKKIESWFIQKDCKVFVNDYALVVLVPFFDFYELFLFYSDNEYLKKILQEIKTNKELLNNKKFKISICGKQFLETTDFYRNLLDLGFNISKKIARFTLPDQDLDNLEYLISLVPVKYRNVEFPNISDAEQILDCIKKDFDLIGDSVPEIDEIRDSIIKKQIVCVKNNETIISFHYYKIINKTYYGLFDYTDSNYRKDFVFFSIMHFMYFFGKNFEINRKYGWRDVLNKRTNKFAKNRGEETDGIFVWNLRL